MISEALSCLEIIKSLIEDIYSEGQALKRLQKNGSELIDFVDDLIKMKDKVEMIIITRNYTIKANYDLHLVIIKKIQRDLVKFKKCLDKYNDYIELINEEKKNIVVYLKLMFKQPKKIERKMYDTMSASMHVCRTIIDLEEKLLGSAKSIEHMLFRRIWVNSCEMNQLNETKLPFDLLIDTIFLMLNDEFKREQKTIIHWNEEEKLKCKSKIMEFFNRIDGSLLANKDGCLSINEINHSLRNNKTTSIHELIDYIPNKELMIIEEPIEPRSKMRLCGV